MTERQERFVAHFATRDAKTWCNATRSAEAAGYAWPDKQGPRLMTRADVRLAVERILFPPGSLWCPDRAETAAECM